MTITYNDATITYNASTVTYNGATTTTVAPTGGSVRRGPAPTYQPRRTYLKRYQLIWWATWELRLPAARNLRLTRADTLRIAGTYEHATTTRTRSRNTITATPQRREHISTTVESRTVTTPEGSLAARLYAKQEAAEVAQILHLI